MKGEKIIWINEEIEKYTLQEWQMFCKFIEFWEMAKPEIFVHEFSQMFRKFRLWRHNRFCW
jgi:hypothetical protein